MKLTELERDILTDAVANEIDTCMEMLQDPNMSPDNKVGVAKRLHAAYKLYASF